MVSKQHRGYSDLSDKPRRLLSPVYYPEYLAYYPIGRRDIPVSFNIWNTTRVVDSDNWDENYAEPLVSIMAILEASRLRVEKGFIECQVSN